jgi:glycosidase
MRTPFALLAGLFAAAQALGPAPAHAADPFTASPAADEVFYQFMPIAWRDGNNDTNRFGDFAGMTASLDYLQSLGVTAVWMTPIFPSPAYHGYQHGPADQLNAWFGDQAGFLSFVAAAKAKNIKVFIDFVAYGINQNTPYFTRGAGGFSGGAYNNPSSQYDTWLAFTNSANTTYQGSVYNTWNGSSVGFIHWDLRTLAAANLVTSWARKWLDPNNDGNTSDGIAGYRFDHCWVNYANGPSGWGYNLSSFWTPFFASLRALKPDVFLFGEQADWGTPGGEFLSQFDAMFTMPFQFAARDAINAANAAGLYSSMDAALASARAAGRGTMIGIVGNHDVDRLASVIGANSAATINRQKAAAAVLLLQPFPPCIYYGDELAMLGTKGNYGSDANDIPMREPFKWNAVAGPPMSNYHVLNSQAYANRFARDNDGRSVQEQTGVPTSVLETYRALVQLRKANPALRRGDYAAVPAAAPAVWAFQRRHAPASGPSQSLLVAVNLSGSTVNTTLNLAGFVLPAAGSAPVSDLVSGAALTTITPANQAAYAVSIPAYGYRVLNADLAPPAPPVSRVDGSALPASFTPAQNTALQAAPTNLGDNQGELNQLLASAEPEGLRVAITGNIPTDFTLLALFVESADTGVSTLYTADQPSPPNGLAQMSGIRFDDAFAPNHLLLINSGTSTFYVDQLALNASSSVKTYRGSNTLNSGSGLLTGGANAPGLQVAINNSNTQGVTASSAANAATATNGVEALIPYSALNLPANACAPIRLSAMLVRSTGAVTSQVLPPVPFRTSDVGIAPNFNTLAGEQFLTIARPASCPPACGLDYNGDRTTNLDDLGDFITDFYTLPPIPANRQPNAPTYATISLGFAAPCPNAPNAPAPYAADAYRLHGYRVGYSADGSNPCPLSPDQAFPNLDNLGDYLTAFYAPGAC